MLGQTAEWVKDRGIALELSVTSNLGTGAIEQWGDDVTAHPIDLLYKLGFKVTVNTDNRLMSGTSMSAEMHALGEAFGLGIDDLRWLTINAMKSAFLPFDQRLALIDEVIKPGYAALQ